VPSTSINKCEKPSCLGNGPDLSLKLLSPVNCINFVALKLESSRLLDIFFKSLPIESFKGH